ncbi:MAG: hypothetical protein RSJ40_01520 [Acetivibrio sp.]
MRGYGKKIFTGRTFRCCMVSIMVVCLIVIALPYSAYGEEQQKIMPQQVNGYKDFFREYQNTETYAIGSREEMDWLAEAVSGGYDFFGKEVTLTEDITITGSWKPIGKENENLPFKGNFNGGGHTIRWDQVVAEGASFGLIGMNDGKISNLKIAGSITSDVPVSSSLVGLNRGVIQNCESAAMVTSSKSGTVGGICGNNLGRIEYCNNLGGVSGLYVGGIAGKNDGGEVNTCFNAGSVTGNSNMSSGGGITGHNSVGNGGRVKNCVNSGSIHAHYAGGISGCNHEGNVENCYNEATEIQGVAAAGGIVGHNNNETSVIANCYTTAGKVLGDDVGKKENCFSGDFKEFTKEQVLKLLQTSEKSDTLPWRMEEGHPVLGKQGKVRIDSQGVTVSMETDSLEYLKAEYSGKWIGGNTEESICLNVKEIAEPQVLEKDREFAEKYIKSQAYEDRDRRYVDIELTKSGTAITETTKAITLCLNIGEDSTSWKMLRVHGADTVNPVTELEDKDSDSKTYTISTDRFSTYILLKPKFPVPPTSPPAIVPTPMPTSPPAIMVTPSPVMPEEGSFLLVPVPTVTPAPSKGPEVTEPEDMEMELELIENKEEGKNVKGESQKNLEKPKKSEELKKVKKSKKPVEEMKSREEEKQKETKRKLDAIPQTGESREKSAAGLIGMTALALYLFSKKIGF